ncbi:hypothetical protein V8F06_007989 [Rhypophila decipiens]
MSGIRLEQPIYVGPGYHTERTIIVDEQIESPETLTIRLEEEAVRGGLRGDSPTGLLPMSAYKPQLQGYGNSPYPDYSPQSLSTIDAQNAHRLRMAFAANSGASGQYLAAQSASNINVLSCHPSSGSHGTKVTLKVTSQYDFGTGAMAVASSPFVSVVFGSQRCNTQIQKESEDANGTCTYTVTTEAPQFLNTGCPSLSNVPLTLLVDGPNGEEIARVNDAGAFTYNTSQGGNASGSVGIGSAGDTSPPDLGSPKRSPVQRTSPPHQSLQMQASTSSSSVHQGLAADPTTNTYGFPPGVSGPTAVGQIQAHAQADYTNTAPSGYNTAASNMIGSFHRTATYPDHYSRVPPVLRSPHGTGWTPFGSQLDSIRGSATALSPSSHTSTTRQGLASLHHTNTQSVPRLIRTSTMNQPGSGSAGTGYSQYPGFYPTKAVLDIVGDLGSMAENWTQEEWANKRRLVMFTKRQNGSQLTASFKPVRESERNPSSTCISCIWWAEKNECFVTSVDTIYLLEQLAAAPSKFTVEEKNRIRRNLEGYHPVTVSKGKAESEEFFKVIMAFGNPKPRNIEKDVKVFPWKTLANALKKIIGKYSASMASVEASAATSHMIPPGMNGSYPLLPPTPNSVSPANASESASAGGYMSTSQHHQVDSMTSPRQLPGVSSWPTYATSARTMSPAVKHETNSPVTSSGLRISTLTAYDSRGAMQNLTSPYSISGPAHHSPHHSQTGYGHSTVPVSQSHTRSWDNYSVADGYSTAASHAHGQVYDGGAYGDGTQRA